MKIEKTALIVALLVAFSWTMLLLGGYLEREKHQIILTIKDDRISNIENKTGLLITNLHFEIHK